MDLKKFLINQKIEMEKEKWIRSQEAGKDLGEDVIKDWVKKYAAQYRKEYNEIYNQLVHKVATDCHEKLKEKFPTVSDEIWEHFVKVVIDKFTETWTKEVACCKDAMVKKHLEEI